MKFSAVLALAALVAAVPFEGVPLHKRDGERVHIGFRTVSKVRRIDHSDICIACKRR